VLWIELTDDGIVALHELLPAEVTASTLGVMAEFARSR
jgi:hypothetical protein